MIATPVVVLLVHHIQHGNTTDEYNRVIEMPMAPGPGLTIRPAGDCAGDLLRVPFTLSTDEATGRRLHEIAYDETTGQYVVDIRQRLGASAADYATALLARRTNQAQPDHRWGHKRRRE